MILVWIDETDDCAGIQFILGNIDDDKIRFFSSSIFNAENLRGSVANRVV